MTSRSRGELGELSADRVDSGDRIGGTLKAGATAARQQLRQARQLLGTAKLGGVPAGSGDRVAQ